MVRLGVPFLTNPHSECVPTALLCGMRYLDKSLKLTRKELMHLMHQRPKHGAYLEQSAWALHKLKWDFNAYATEPLDYGRPYRQHVTYLQTQRRGLITYETFTEKEMRAALDRREMVIIAADYKRLHQQAGSVEGHAVVMTGYDGDDFFFHENGSRYYGDPAIRHFRINKKRLHLARKYANFETIVLRGARHVLNSLAARPVADRHPQSGQAEGIWPDARPHHHPLDLGWRNEPA